MRSPFFPGTIALVFLVSILSRNVNADDAAAEDSWDSTIQDSDDDSSSNETLSFWNSTETEAPTLSETVSNLSLLLEAHNLTTMSLTKMFLGTYFPANPRDSDSADPGEYWRAQIVTPTPQGINGSLVQAVLFSNEYRNPENPQRVLAFAGIMYSKKQKKANAESACLAAAYGFKGTDAESAFQKTCLDMGYVAPNMTEWAAQAGALIESTNATFLTGHKLGCDIAKSEGLLHPNLPVVCWSATGSLTEAWIDAYPGLAEAIRGRNQSLDDENRTVYEKADIWNTSSYPENDRIYVIQTRTDPTSNCLLPPETPGRGLAHVCLFPAWGRCDGRDVAFEYDLFSACSDRPSSTLALFYGPTFLGLPEDCISREYVGVDVSLRDCPYQQIYYTVYNDTTNDTSSNETASGGSHFLIRNRANAVQLLVLLLFTARLVID